MRNATCAAALLLLASAGTGAAEAGTAPSGKNPLKNVCMFVDNRTADTLPGSTFTYRYQRAFITAAGVDISKDDAAEVSRKVSGYWADHQAGIRCNSLQFDVPDGSLLKFAALTQFDAFLYDAIAWRLDLNHVDASDQRTVLDYIRDHRDRAAGSVTAGKMQAYYDLLRKAGAKHRTEL